MINKEKIFDLEIFFDSSNSNFSLSEVLLQNKKSYDFDNYKWKIDQVHQTFITICINLSDMCNLKCDYCFNAVKSGKSIDIKLVKDFLSYIFKKFPDKEKYYIDLSGKGEPLLFLDKILKIKEYCINISNRIGKEVLVSFVSNGTLLSTEIASVLQKNGILFGVSLDGNEYVHNLHRKTNKGEDTYQTIINNVKNIKNHEYVGAATTLTKDVFSLVDSIKELGEIFNTVGYKPARNCLEAFDSESIDRWLVEYDKLTLFLLDECIKGNDKYIKILLNGDDYFGKFIKRILSRKRVFFRCDGGLSRFTLDINGNVYICPSAYSIPKYQIGDFTVIDRLKQIEIFELQTNREYCSFCSVKFLCGGECLVEKELSNGKNSLMCKYKKHLILLAIYFIHILSKKNLEMFNKVLKFVGEINKRRKIDLDLVNFMKKNYELSFIEAKTQFDKENKRY